MRQTKIVGPVSRMKHQSADENNEWHFGIMDGLQVLVSDEHNKLYTLSAGSEAVETGRQMGIWAPTDWWMAKLQN